MDAVAILDKFYPPDEIDVAMMAAAAVNLTHSRPRRAVPATWKSVPSGVLNGIKKPTRTTTFPSISNASAGLNQHDAQQTRKTGTADGSMSIGTPEDDSPRAHITKLPSVYVTTTSEQTYAVVFPRQMSEKTAPAKKPTRSIRDDERDARPSQSLVSRIREFRHRPRDLSPLRTGEQNVVLDDRTDSIFDVDMIAAARATARAPTPPSVIATI